MKQFAVIGLGRFGSEVARTLAEKKQQVITIDKNEELVQDMMDVVMKSVCMDCTDEKAVRSIGLQNVDVAICAIGTDVESSILVTLLLKDLGVPVIVCKAISIAHKKVLKKIGATKVVLPERDMGERLANTLISSSESVLDHIGLTDSSSIIEIVVPEGFVGKSLRDLNIRAEYSVNVIAVKKIKEAGEDGKKQEEINVTPQADDMIAKNDILVVFGENDNIDKMKKAAKEFENRS